MAILKRLKPTLGVAADRKRSVGDFMLEVEQHGIRREPLDLKEIVKLHDIALRVVPMDAQVSGYLKKEEGRWIIGVNSLHHPRRQRFTIAHELGHYVLHRDRHDQFEDKVLFRAESGGDFNEETQANSFAASILMPEERFREVITELNGNVQAIAEVFEVSSLAVSFRARSLGYSIKD